ncbi:MAG: N-acetylglucosaminyl transferase [Chlorobi bacterium OLB4]|nr:MAG: N-acetylglucosaminyl transferase [Chlorobi bacterium OLB4]
MNFLFAGGGTGGHVFPALAIADELKKMDSSSDILFVGAKGKIEERLVPQNGYRLETISIEGLKRNLSMSNFSLVFKLVRSVIKSKKIIKEFNPQVVIGTGGFVSLPVLYSATSMKKKTLIQEGNYYPGLTTKFLAPKVNKVVVNFEGTKELLKRKDNIIKIGHPIRSALKISDPQEAKIKLGISLDKFTVLVFGGSQGARGINNAIGSLVEEFLKNEINLIWQTGKSDFGELSGKFANKENVLIQDFFNDMGLVYSAADLVVCRSGITSIMELASLRKAVIFIPFPDATDNHQESNAKSLEAEGAAFIILQKDVAKGLFPLILELKNNKSKLNDLEKNIKKFEDTKAAKKNC